MPDFTCRIAVLTVKVSTNLFSAENSEGLAESIWNQPQSRQKRDSVFVVMTPRNASPVPGSVAPYLNSKLRVVLAVCGAPKAMKTLAR